MNLEFIEAIDALAKEKHISKDVIFEAIESAVVSAYKKNFGTSHQNVRVEINQQTGEILAGTKPGRESDDELIVCSNIGISVNDIAVGQSIMMKAFEQGVGTILPL